MMVATQPLVVEPNAIGLGIEWQEVPCPLCGEECWDTVAEASDNDPASQRLRFAVVECRYCGLWYTNPRPSPASIAQFYADGYKPHHIPKHRRAPASMVRRWFAPLMGRPCLERHFIPRFGAGRLLDFGCGGGEFLLRMRDQGWNVTGLDSSSKVIRFLRREYALNGMVGTIPCPDWAAESFDVITMWASLEHVHEPLQVLRDAHRLLSNRGRLYVQVHNLDSWDRKLFGPDWYSLDLPRHLTHFTSNTLHMMLERAGFAVKKITQVSHPSATRKSLQIAMQSGAAGFSRRLLGVKPFRLLWSWLAYMGGGGDHLFAFAEKA